MLTITSLISGWRIGNFDEVRKSVEELEISLLGCLKVSKLTKAETLKWISDNYDLRTITENDEKWIEVWLGPDDVYKVAIMEKHPDLEQQLKEHFGENWANHYLRFGH